MTKHLIRLMLPCVLGLLIAAAPAHGIDASIHSAGAAARPSGNIPNFALGAPQLPIQYAQAKKELETAFQAIVAIPDTQRTFDNTVKAFDTAWAVYSDRIQPLTFLGYVSPDPEVRDAAKKLEEESGQYGVALMNRADLYSAIKAYADNDEAKALSGEDKRLLDLTLEGFKHSGVGLSEEKRLELKALQQRLAVLASRFQANIDKDESIVEADGADLDGLPQSLIEGLGRTPEGKYEIKLEHYATAMRSIKNAELRRRLELTFNNRSLENLPLLEETLRLRHQSAQILGYASYPHMALTDRMAQTPEAVWKFLNDLVPLLREKGDHEIQELLALKRRYDPSATRLSSWDARYYAAKLREERYGFDDEQVRQYFPVDRVVNGTMRIYEKILGVKFAEIPNEGAWHKDARLFAIADSETGRPIGHFYLDLYPREGKYKHAAAFPLISGYMLNGQYNEPVAAMVANLNKPQEGRPALLSFGDVNTFFHEFGHIMHQTLTTARHASLSGSSVAEDFVEAPSQMMENFIWEPEVVRELAGHWQNGSEIPAELFQKMRTAGRAYDDYSGLTTGLHYLRQLSFAMIDMLLHASVPQLTTALYNQISYLVNALPAQMDTHPEASFGHLMGYGAGYYSYLWAEVFADDIYSVFQKEGLFGPVGLRYRRAILERGSGRPEMESLVDFLGREPNPDAFMRKLNGDAPDAAGKI